MSICRRHLFGTQTPHSNPAIPTHQHPPRPLDHDLDPVPQNLSRKLINFARLSLELGGGVEVGVGRLSPLAEEIDEVRGDRRIASSRRGRVCRLLLGGLGTRMSMSGGGSWRIGSAWLLTDLGGCSAQGGKGATIPDSGRSGDPMHRSHK